jgi:two-component system phosphate regulon sensor histidine kinase PhoR
MNKKEAWPEGPSSAGDLALLTMLADLVDEGLLLAGCGGRILFCSARFEEILGLETRIDSLEEMVVGIASHFRSCEELARVTGNLSQGKLTPGKLLLKGTDPERRTLQMEWVPIAPRGTSPGVLIVARDVTWQKRQEWERREMIHAMFHALKSPISSIIMSINLLLEGEAGEINEIQREFLSISAAQVERLRNLIENLLDVERMEEGMLALDYEDVNLREVLEKAFITHKAQASLKGLTFSSDLRDDLVLKGNRERLFQIFDNLLSNAVKYTEEGGVTVEAREEDLWIRVAVRDTGIGLEEVDRVRIFEKFYRVDAPGGKGEEGTGLGLTITRGLVAMHGGTIEVWSEPGKGSEFAVRLPRNREESSARPDA